MGRWRWPWAGGANATHRRETDRVRRRVVVRLPTLSLILVRLGHENPRARNCSSSTPTRSTRSSPPKWVVRRCSRRGSGMRRPRAAAAPPPPGPPLTAGISASARPVADVPVIPDFRSSWRPSGNACRTSTTSRAGRVDDRYRPARVRYSKRNRETLAVRASLLFGYVGAFMYEGDTRSPNARPALSLDSTLLAELLAGWSCATARSAGHRRDGRQLQHLSDDRVARDARRRGPAAAAGR